MAMCSRWVKKILNPKNLDWLPQEGGEEVVQGSGISQSTGSWSAGEEAFFSDLWSFL